jgi:TolB-like protein/DNA-binding winged helix-turn-helix (wHTH) protein/Tfp pilus assembly protein PilF
MTKRFYQFGHFRIDKVNHVLLRDGKVLPLKPKVFDTLLVLVEARDRVLDKDEMMSRLWPDAVVEESNLSQNIYLLRKVLGEADHGGVFIETIPKRGYRFVASISEFDDEIPKDQLRPPEATRPDEVPSQLPAIAVHQQTRRTNLVAVALALGIVGVVTLVALSYFRSRSDSVSKTVSGPPVKSIAILPFKPLSSDANDQVLGLGMTDTLIIRLNHFRQFEVRPLTAVREFDSANQDAVAAGRKLKVDAVLDGTIQRDGDQIRVNVRLVQVSDGSVLWAEKIDEKATNSLEVQDRISERVAREMVPQMTGEDQKLLAKHFTENADAHRLYMMGRYHWSKTNPDDWNKAIEYFNSAIERDPNYALAYTGLADCYLSIVADSLLAKSEAIPKAKEAAMTALRLDDTLAEAHVSLGRIKAFYDWDWTGGESEFKRALELNSNSGDAHREYAAYLTSIGRSDEAVAEALRARAIDPLSNVTNFQVAWALISAGRYDDAIEESRQVVAMLPTAHYWMCNAYLAKGMNQQAAAECETMLSINKGHLMAKATLAYASASLGREDNAKKVLVEFKQLFKQQQASPYHVAMVYAGLRDKDQAFTWLDEAYREHSRPLVNGLKVNPVWGNLRSDPRFTNLLHRMGLPE